MTSHRPTFSAADFRKALRSNPDRECVHVARRAGWVEMRDTKKTFGAADDHRLVFTADQFDRWLAGVVRGDLTGHCVEIAERSDGVYVFRSTVPQPSGASTLEFLPGEVEAFYAGVTNGEFSEAAFMDSAA